MLVENHDYFQKNLIHSLLEVFHVMELNYIFRDFHLYIKDDESMEKGVNEYIRLI